MQDRSVFAECRAPESGAQGSLKLGERSADEAPDPRPGGRGRHLGPLGVACGRFFRGAVMLAVAVR